MDDMLGVSGLQRVSHFSHQLYDLVGVARLSVDVFPKRSAFEQFHHQERTALEFAHIIGAGLPLEAHTQRAFDQSFREHLNGYIPLQPGVVSLVDRSHPAAPEEADDAIRSDLFSHEVGYWAALRRFADGLGDGCDQHVVLGLIVGQQGFDLAT